MRLELLLVTAVLATFACGENVIASELNALQGKWEFHFQQQGRQLRAVKIVEGDKETVETFDGDKLVHRHIVKLEALEANGLTIIKYGESEITDGPRKGQKGVPGSFVSKLWRNKWYNIQGLESKSDAPLLVMEFTKISNP